MTTNREGMGTRKRQAYCVCGHEYEDHELGWDEKRQRFKFSNTGKCTKCECGACKLATPARKRRE